MPVKIIRFALFAEVITDKLFKKGSASSLKGHLKNLLVEKSTVRYRGVITNSFVNEPPPRPPGGGTGGGRTELPRASIPEVMDDLRNVFQITYVNRRLHKLQFYLPAVTILPANKLLFLLIKKLSSEYHNEQYRIYR